MTAQTDPSTVAALEPRAVWGFFAGMAAIPRPSKQEQRIREHLQKVAGKHGLAARTDAAGNLVIHVPASPGHEQAPVTVLQGHLDMVCEKNADTVHDFDREGMKLVLEVEPEGKAQIVRADGTTLGADNGIGLALALAAATSQDVIHGPLELLCTVDEEAGMTGAKALTPESFRGRRMLNLDSEEDDAIYMGCAGGCDSNLIWEADLTTPLEGIEACRVAISGLRGGHSGGDIHENRGNAIKLLTRTLQAVPTMTLHLMSIEGGSKRNAIPREAQAVVAGPAGTHSALQAAAEEIRKAAVEESAEAKAMFTVEPVPLEASGLALPVMETDRILTALAALPNGVLGMHPQITGLVETSNNVSTVRTTTARGRVRIEVGTLSRSSSAERLDETLDRIAEVGVAADAAVETGNRYPGWDPDPGSPTLAVCRRIYENLFGEEAKVTAIHAGLECGIIGERVGNMDMVSFGPTIRGAHSPDERVYVASVQKVWRYLVAVLKELARG